MPVQIQSTGSVTVASLSGEIDHHLAGPMRTAIDDACTQTNARTLVLDFGGVTFMDSSGVGLVMGRYKLMQALGGELILSNLPSPIRKVMRMAGLDRLAVMEPRTPYRRVPDRAEPETRSFTEEETDTKPTLQPAASVPIQPDGIPAEAQPPVPNEIQTNPEDAPPAQYTQTSSEVDAPYTSVFEEQPQGGNPV